MRKIIEKCPSCGHGQLIVTNLQCPECGTEVRGAFVASRFCRLQEQSLQFLETFVRNRGNLKEMERELNISYASLRSRLNEIIEEMGYQAGRDKQLDESARPDRRVHAIERQVILRRLQDGEISPDEAIEALRRL